MSKIIVLGNSLAAGAAVKEIRHLDPSSEVTLFCTEQVLPYDRALLPSLVNKDIKESQMLFAPEGFYGDQKVRLVRDEALVRVSTKRRQLTAESKNHYAFDKLLVTDLPQCKVPAVKGHQRKGVFSAVALGSIKDCMAYMPFVDTVIVPVTGFLGFNMACALKRLGKEVVALAPAPGVLPRQFDEETASLLKQIVEGKGIRTLTDSVEEILGDAEVKAVRMRSGKVMAAEAVVYDTVEMDLRLLAETGLLADDGRLALTSGFLTPLKEVVMCDAMTGNCDLESEASAEHGRCAAQVLLAGPDAVYNPPMLWRDFGHKMCDGFCGGVIRLPEGGREHMMFDGPQNVFKKVYVKDDCLVGAVWFNAPGDRDNVRDALAKRVCLAGSEDRFLHSAQV